MNNNFHRGKRINQPTKGKLRFSGHSQKTICRYSAIAVYAFKGPLAEGAGSAMFFRRDWRRVDLGFCFALGLTIFRIFRGFRRGHCVALKTCAAQCNTPSDPAQNRAPAHLPRRGRLLKYKSLFIFPRNRVNRRLDVPMTTRNKAGKPQAHFGASRIFRPC